MAPGAKTSLLEEPKLGEATVDLAAEGAGAEQKAEARLVHDFH